MTRLLTCLALLALCLGPVASHAGADEAPTLGIEKTKIRFGKPGQGDSMTVKGRFDPGLVSPGFSPDLDPCSFSVGSASVLSSGSGDGRETWKESKASKFLYTVKKDRDRPDSLKLVLDLSKGRFSLKARRVDLESLKAAGPEDVTFTLTVGDAVFSNTITLGDKDGLWRFRFVKNAGGWPPGIPGINNGGGGGGGTGGGGAVSFRILPLGPMMGLPNFTTTVVRTGTQYNAEWAKRYPPLPPGSKAPVMVAPKVDFTKEMVVIIDLGMRPSGGYAMDIRKVTALGNGLLVEWVEKKPGANCVVPTVITQPFIMAAVSRRDGSVSFTGSVQTVNCP